MASEDRNRDDITQAGCTDCTPRERSFDELTRGLADGSLSRRKALRLFGGALVGSVLASIPGVALAKPPAGTCLQEGKVCKTNTECCSQNCETRKGKRVCGPAVQCTGSGQGNCTQPPNQCQQVLCNNGFCGAVQNKPNGSGCNDNNPCTNNDQCTGGVCAGTLDPDCVACANNNDCATFGTPGQCEQAVCDQALGVCVVENKADGTGCNDNNPCTDNDECTAGVCEGELDTDCVRCDQNATACEAIEVDQCFEAVCTQAGICEVRVRSGSCNDGNPCTNNDQCNAAGVCEGELDTDCVRCDQNATACEAIEVDQCFEAVCTQAGICEVRVRENGTCDDGNPCTSNDQCDAAGVCAGTLDTDCVRCDQGGQTDCDTIEVTQCQEAVCTQAGICEVRVRENGACDDGNACTSNDQCNAAGACVGTQIANCVTCQNASTCPQGTACQTATCNGGICGFELKEAGTTCNDDNPCTTNDRCTAAGVCAGTAVTCPSGQTCAPTTGICVCTTGTTCGTECCAANRQCCPAGSTRQGCQRLTGATCTNNNQCCNACVLSRCT